MFASNYEERIRATSFSTAPVSRGAQKILGWCSKCNFSERAVFGYVIQSVDTALRFAIEALMILVGFRGFHSLHEGDLI